MPFEPFDEATRFGGGEGFVERRRRVRAEIVLNQNDFVRVGKIRVGHILERVGVIDGRATVGDFHLEPWIALREKVLQDEELEQCELAGLSPAEALG